MAIIIEGLPVRRQPGIGAHDPSAISTYPVVGPDLGTSILWMAFVSRSAIPIGQVVSFVMFDAALAMFVV